MNNLNLIQKFLKKDVRDITPDVIYFLNNMLKNPDIDNILKKDIRDYVARYDKAMDSLSTGDRLMILLSCGTINVKKKK